MPTPETRKPRSGVNVERILVREIDRITLINAELLAALEQIARLSIEADRSAIDLPSTLGDIARAAIAKAKARS